MLSFSEIFEFRFVHVVAANCGLVFYVPQIVKCAIKVEEITYFGRPPRVYFYWRSNERNLRTFATCLLRHFRLPNDEVEMYDTVGGKRVAVNRARE